MDGNATILIFEARRMKPPALEPVPRLASMAWRVEVVLASKALKRVLMPRVVMFLTSEEGDTRRVECTMEEFHALRSQVAEALRSVCAAEERGIYHKGATR